MAIRISSISYVFMGFTVGIQGILQGLRYYLKPLILSFLRLIVFVFPIASVFTLFSNVSTLVWITFIIAEVATAIIAFFLAKKQLIGAVETSNIKLVEETLFES